MAKRKKKRKPDFRTTIKLPDEIEDAVRTIQRETGWSYGKTVGFLSGAGVDLIYGKGAAVGPMRAVLAAATATHLAEVSAAAQLSSSRAQLREATRRMKELAVNPEDLPELPAPGEEPRRRRGRPRKHSAVPPYTTAMAHERIGVLRAELAEPRPKPTGATEGASGVS